MQIDANEIQKIGKLAKLSFDKKEQEKYAENLNKILDFVEQMNQYDTTGITPMAHPLDIAQPMRKDAVTEPDVREDMLKLAPEANAGLYVVPQVIEDKES